MNIKCQIYGWMEVWWGSNGNVMIWVQLTAVWIHREYDDKHADLGAPCYSDKPGWTMERGHEIHLNNGLIEHESWRKWGEHLLLINHFLIRLFHISIFAVKNVEEPKHGRAQRQTTYGQVNHDECGKSQRQQRTSESELVGCGAGGSQWQTKLF